MKFPVDVPRVSKAPGVAIGSVLAYMVVEGTGICARTLRKGEKQIPKSSKSDDFGMTQWCGGLRDNNRSGMARWERNSGVAGDEFGMSTEWGWRRCELWKEREKKQVPNV